MRGRPQEARLSILKNKMISESTARETDNASEGEDQGDSDDSDDVMDDENYME